MKFLQSFFSASLDILFPPSCPYCNTKKENSDDALCEECYAQLKFIKTPYCDLCGRSFQGNGENHLCGDCLKSSWAFDKARSPFAYEDVIAGLVHKLKYSGDMNGLTTFRRVIGQTTLLDDLTSPDCIIPVPLHIKRLRKRGFNQALVLVRSVFPEGKEKIRHDILVRNRDTHSQRGLGGVERRQNLKDAFVVTKPEVIAGKNILLFDDVFTTGTTAQECAKVLKAAGCKRVEVLTICRADKKFF